METRYDHRLYEEKWWNFWEQQNYFNANNNSQKEPYVILMPPPNVTDRLHMGHGLNNTLQDIYIRWQRMSGKEVCWLPGTDHAGIATQMMVEKSLQSEGTTRKQLGRERFVERCWRWQEKHGGIIIDQLKRLGASADWQRLAFTMSPELSHAVRTVFVDLYEKGLIYRGERLVNWDFALQTAISDDEVVNVEETGKLWFIAYPLADAQGELVVATTRPETMFGDTAVAVNPDDERYQQYIGKHVTLPLVGRSLPVIADTFVKSEFGTGCLKVTPAHDFNDFEVGKRHNLPTIDIFSATGLLGENVPSGFQGMTRTQARQSVLQALQKLNLLRGEKKHRLTLPYSDRSKAIIEPRLSQQWFLRMQPLVGEAIRVAKDNELRFYPATWKKTYLHWLENIKDWCISRQLWWGHRIPVWYCRACQQIFAERRDPSVCKHCQSKDIQQDEDVLDTWFSSWLWAFSTLGYPDGDPADLRKFYPSQVLITGADIIFLWVARMVIAGIEVVGASPFKDVYFNSIICDHQGRKFSKTLGNGIDPLAVIDKYGADAVRYTCVSLAPLGSRARMGVEDFAHGGKFINKLWNAARFLRTHMKGTQTLPALNSTALTLPEKWLCNELADTCAVVEARLRAYRVNSMAERLYHFIWGTYCDWGIEVCKSILQKGTLPAERILATMVYVLEGLLRLAHPLIPFISEEIWQRLPAQADWQRPASLVIASFPDPKTLHRFAEPRIDGWRTLQSIITSVRSIRSRTAIPPKEQINVSVVLNTQQTVVVEHAGWLQELAGVAQADFLTANAPRPQQALVGVGKGYEVYAHVVSYLDVAKEREKLARDKQRLQRALQKAEQKLEKATAGAPPEVLEKQRAVKHSLQEQLQGVELNLSSLE